MLPRTLLSVVLCFCSAIPGGAFVDDSTTLIQQAGDRDRDTHRDYGKNNRNDPLTDREQNNIEDLDDLGDDEEVKVAKWEEIEAANGLHLGNGGNALVSGALVFSLIRNMLLETLAEHEDLLNNVSTELLERNDLNAGFKGNMKQETDGTGTYFISELHPGCEEHNMFGDTGCTFTWGQDLIVHGGVQVEKQVESGSMVNIKLKTHFLNKVLPESKKKHPDVSIACAACGAPCQIKTGIKTVSVDVGPCPLQPGFYDYWSESFKLKDNLVVKLLDFKSDILMSIAHPNGTNMFFADTTLETYTTGTGGGWKA